MGVVVSHNKNSREFLYRKDELRFLLVEDKTMDKYSKRFLWLATQMLSDCELDSAAERADLREIVRRLQEMALGVADELSCERVSQEIREKTLAARPGKTSSN